MRVQPVLVWAVLCGAALSAAAVEVVERQTATPVPWDKKNAFVLSAARDGATGNVWVGTELAGAWCFDGKQWTQHSAKSGLADDTVHALAVDLQGRVWAGHVNRGVSVFDGKTWRNYGPVTGGPLGSRVFAIEVCPSGPRAGEVWVASDAGLARYWPTDDSWTYLTRADGLPADQVQCIAFDADGRVFAGTQCDGLAIASPADDYAAWTHVDGPTRPGTTATGDGLPSCLINDVLVSREGTIYVATPWGLGKSTDGGKTFTHRRGADWAAKVKQRTGGAPAGFQAPPKGQELLAEDYVTCLAEDAVGLLWVGYRTAGFDALDEPSEVEKLSAAAGPAPGRPGEFVTCIVPLFGAGPVVGTYGGGVLQAEKWFGGEGELRPAPVAAGRVVGRHPSPAKAPGPRAVDKMQARVAALKGPGVTAAFLGDDWTTQGDGIGRYGRQVYSFPFYGPGGWAQGYKADMLVGPHQSKNKGGPYTYYAELDSKSPRVQWIPNNFKRHQGEWNDGSFDRDAYHDTWEGPDLWVDVTVPAGVHRMSLYFVNWDAHGGAANRRRDFFVEVKAKAATREEADFASPLARARVRDFYHGVYKQFVLTGPAEYAVKIGRNYSVATKVSGIFFDRLQGAAPPNEPTGVPMMGDVQVKPPAVEDPTQSTDVAVRAAAAVWAGLDKGWDRADAVALQRPYRVQAMRVAAEAEGGGGPDGALLANWRFALPITTTADRAEFARTVARAREKWVEQNPHVAETAFRAKFADQWKKLQKGIAAGTAPDAATLFNPKPDVTNPEAVKAVLAPYLTLRAGRSIGPRSLSTNDNTVEGTFAEFKGLAADRKALYHLLGEYVLYSEALAERPDERTKRRALAVAVATTRAALELLDDTWLAARLSEAMLAPRLADAAADDGTAGRAAVLKLIAAAHTDDPEGRKALTKKVVEAAKPDEREAVRKGLEGTR